MKLETLRPPADVDDGDGIQNHREVWSSFLSFVTEREVRRLGKQLSAVNLNLKPQYFNPLNGDPSTTPDHLAQSWSGFPRVAEKRYGALKFEEAERLRTGILGYTKHGSPVAHMYRYQDEYLEWHADRSSEGRITKVTFTCEGPEWWSALANGSPSAYYSLDSETPVVFRDSRSKGDLGKVVSLYRTLLGTEDVAADDLVFHEDIYDSPPSSAWRCRIFAKGEYNPWNEWNTARGAIHLTHPANTLGAEINLAAQATVRRKSGNFEVTDATHLICCSGYGNPTRNSDPAIGYFVNGFARANRLVTLWDPIGLYITGLDSAGVLVDGKPDSSLWKIIRPTKQVGDPYKRYLRVSFEVPDGKTLAVDGMRLDYGGQLATKVTMMLVGAADGPSPEVPLLACSVHGCKSTANPDLVTAIEPEKQCIALGGYEDLDQINITPVPVVKFNRAYRRSR